MDNRITKIEKDEWINGHVKGTHDPIWAPCFIAHYVDRNNTPSVSAGSTKKQAIKQAEKFLHWEDSFFKQA